MANDIPDDILRGLDEAFKYDADSFSRVLFFLSDCISQNIEEPFIRSLQWVLSKATVFKKVAERMVEDTKMIDKDPKYRQVMYDVWNNFLKDNLTEHPDGGQGLELLIPPKSNSFPVVQYCFLRAVSRLPPESFKGLVTTVSSMGGLVAKYGGRALNLAQKAQPVVRVALLAVYLALNVIKNIRRWWNGEISGTRCVKNILDCGVGVAAGIGGGIGGEMIGAGIGSVFGPVGTACGAIVGAIVGGGIAAITAETLCSRLTQWVFGLPKSEALENAFNFLAVSPTASNSIVNTKYRSLALQYHPDKGGDAKKWTRLQYSMAIIREARGEL